MGKLTFCLVCGLVFMIPFEMLGGFDDFPSVMRILGLATLGCACVAVITGHRLRTLSLAMTLRVLLVVWAVFSLAWSMVPDVTQEVIIRMLLLLVFALLIWEFVRSEAQQILMLRSFLVGMLVPLAMQFGAFLGVLHIDADPDTVRYTGGGQDQNYLAMMYVASALIAVYLAANESQFDHSFRWIYYGYALAAVVGVGLTGSRTGLVSMVLPIIFGGLIAGLSVKNIVKLVVSIVFGGIIFVYVVPAALKGRLGELSLEADTMVVRLNIWERDGAAYLQQPLAGVGEGAVGLAAARLTGERAEPPHNTLLSVLYELGPLALLVFIAFLALLTLSAWRMPWRERMLWLGLLSIWFVGSMGAGSQIDKFGWFIQAALMTQAALNPRRQAAGGKRADLSRGAPLASNVRGAAAGQ